MVVCADTEMQQALLQQAEAVWQAQHDRLASELAEARHVGEKALADAMAQQADADKAKQVTSSPTMRHRIHPSVMHTRHHSPAAAGDHPSCLAQTMRLASDILDAVQSCA